ncbi:BTAD domain-containing putative transcriptional regulator [Naasia sp. SYSU D00948]|uniref:BTAD domain-containing putative transcriptional regulator n=1 Tax=Naasia sp. SYSU D00948 TaxID=2817379 RepID=UPI001B3076FD|nr:BTAD domain-containing putative transcriptional regulator [Naasia sp. SYSU D00948]
MSVEFEVFGPLTVRRDGRVLPVPGELPRAILARLALDAGETVDADRLVGDVWQEPGDGALSSLRAYLSRLRAAGFEGLLQGSRSGYSLDVPAEAVDLHRFRAGLASLGRLGGSDEALELAAALVRLSAAEPFAGIDAPFVAPARLRIREERRGVVERHAELRLARGDHAAAVVSMTSAVEEYPYDEKPTRLLALALARSGRVSDALEAIDAFGARLAAWRGLEPPARILELRQSIVRHDPEVLGRSVRQVARTGLPHPLTRFIGRREELAAVASARAGHRLVTLVGPGGVGKTRIAIEAARSTGDDDEQWFVDLASVREPDQVLPLVADTVGAAGHTLEHITPRIAERRTLLVFDNAEHVIGAVAAVASGLLSRGPSTSLLVTSREPLRLPGEHVIPVAPMALPDARVVFGERAADARGGVLAAEDEDAIDAICEALEGIPLALELTAARLDVLSSAELLEAVHDGAGPDERGSGSARHDSVENAVRWSIDLLTPAQQQLLTQLSRFAGSFTEEAALGICDCDDDEPERVLARLVDKSLVSVSHGDAGQRRYRLLDSVRRAAAAIDDPDPEWYDRHRRWMADFAERIGPVTRTADARVANATLDLLRADLRAALDHAVEAEDRLCALRIAGSQAHHWFSRGLLLEGVRNIERALAVPGEVPPLVEAHALLGLTVLAYQTGDAERAFQTIARAFELAMAAGDAAIPAVALARTAYGRSLLLGDADEARELMGQAAQFAEAAPAWARAEVLMCRGQTLRALGASDEALESLDEAYEVATSAGYAWMMCSASYIAGKVLTDQRRGREAIAELRRASLQALAAEDHASTLAGFHQIAGACALVERHEEGARILGAVDRIGVRYNYNPVVAEGEETRRLREHVAQGLTASEFERAYADGAALEIPDLFELVDALPQRSRELVTAN